MPQQMQGAAASVPLVLPGPAAANLVLGAMRLMCMGAHLQGCRICVHSPTDKTGSMYAAKVPAMGAPGQPAPQAYLLRLVSAPPSGSTGQPASSSDVTASTSGPTAQCLMGFCGTGIAEDEEECNAVLECLRRQLDPAQPHRAFSMLMRLAGGPCDGVPEAAAPQPTTNWSQAFVDSGVAAMAVRLVPWQPSYKCYGPMHTLLHRLADCRSAVLEVRRVHSPPRKVFMQNVCAPSRLRSG